MKKVPINPSDIGYTMGIYGNIKPKKFPQIAGF